LKIKSFNYMLLQHLKKEKRRTKRKNEKVNIDKDVKVERTGRSDKRN
jgi:hypothetical protein